MRLLSDLTGRARLYEVLRWLCVLPAAFLGDIVAQFVSGAAVQIAKSVGGGVLGDSTFTYSLGVFLYYVPRKSVFVIAGAKMAPRVQMATAIGLMVLGILISLMTHVVGQHLAGNRVGIVNYIHFLAESGGALCGMACILFHVWRKRQIERIA
jgi:hypothetical protein